MSPTATGPAHRVLRYTYDDARELTGVIDTLYGRTWEFGYGVGHRLVSIQDPRGGTETIRYDAARRVVGETDPMHVSTAWSYDGLGVAGM